MAWCLAPSCQTQTTVDVGRHQQSIKSPGTSTINHQLSPSDTSVPRIFFGEVSSKRRRKKNQGPKPPDFAMRLAEPSQVFCWTICRTLKNTQRKNTQEKTQQLGNNNLNDCFYISLEFFFCFYINRYQSFYFINCLGSWKKTPGICMTLRTSSPPMEVCPAWFKSQSESE